MYVCIHVCMSATHVIKQVITFARKHGIYVCVCARDVCMYVRMYVLFMHVYVCMHVRMYVRMCACM